MPMQTILVMFVALVLAILGGVITYHMMTKDFKKLFESERIFSSYTSEEKKHGATMSLLTSTLDRLFPLTNASTEKYIKKLEAAGMFNVSASMWRVIVLSTTVACFLGGLLVGFLLRVPLVFVLGCAVFGGFIGWLGVNAYLSSKISSRRKKIEATLPGAIELLSVMINAGLPIERGFKEIGDNSSGIGVVAEEFARVDREINSAGADYCDALMDMAERCDSDDMRAFASSLVQARKQGSSIVSILETQAVVVRKTYFDAIKEKINKTEAKISIPLGCCFLPAIIVMSMAPTVASMMEMLPAMFG